MAQQQPESLPYWRSREIIVGPHNALREAAEAVDTLKDELGRKIDLQTAYVFSIILACLLIGFLSGYAVGVRS